MLSSVLLLLFAKVNLGISLLFFLFFWRFLERKHGGCFSGTCLSADILLAKLRQRQLQEIAHLLRVSCKLSAEYEWAFLDNEKQGDE